MNPLAFFIILFFPSAILAKSFVEIQSSQLSQKADSAHQSFSNEDHQMIYGSLGAHLKLYGLNLKTNAYLNHSQSRAYEENPEIMDSIIHPRQVNTRDLFRFQERQTGHESSGQATLNQFEWVYGDKEIQFSAGRFWVNFGSGEFINPINPFRSSTAFSNLNGIEQSVDGMRWQIQRDPQLKLQIFILGDRVFYGDDTKIAKSAMISGQWKKSDKTLITYILGEDQERQKYGVEINHQLPFLHLYGQFMRQTQRIDLEVNESQNLTHYVFGSELKLKKGFSLLGEFGKLQNDRLVIDDQDFNLGLLPIEDFVFLKLKFLSDNQKFSTELGYAIDTRSQFSFVQGQGTYQITTFITTRLFSSVQTQGPEEENSYLEQDIFPQTKLGAALTVLF